MSHERVLKDYKEESDNLQSCLKTTNRYLTGEAGPLAIMQKLSKKGTRGRWLAGEVALDQGHTYAANGQHHMVSSVMGFATNYFNRANEMPSFRPHEVDNSVLRAKLRLAQMPAYQAVLQQNQLPSNMVTSNIYRKMISLGLQTSNSIERHVDLRSNNAMMLFGTLGEIAVNTLAMRYSLRKIGSDSWLPLMSSLSQEHGETCLAKSKRPTWNVSIFTHIDTSKPVETSYQLAIKTKDATLNLTDPSVTSPDHQVLCIDPDLRINKSERSMARIILLSAQLELEDPARHTRLSAELDERTEKFLEAIDR